MSTPPTRMHDASDVTSPTSPAAPKPDGHLVSPADVLRRIGKCRDGLLVLATVVYLLGYVSWALYTWRNELGMIPALEAQYFSAGIAPAFIIALFYVSVKKILLILTRWSQRKLTEPEKRVGKILKGVCGILLLASFVIGYLLGRESTVHAVLFYGAIALFYVAVFFSQGIVEKGLRYYAIGTLWFFTAWSGFLLLFAYWYWAFPEMPQELGGPAPRCVQFDLDAERLSPTSRSSLLPEGQAKDAKGVHRSRELYLIFESSDFVLIRESDDPFSLPVRAHKLRKEAIQGMFPCGRPASARGGNAQSE